MNRTGDGRPRTVGERDGHHAGSGAAQSDRTTTHPVATEGRAPLPTRVEGLPRLPPEYTTTLERGLEVLDVSLPGEVRAAIDDHVRLLIAWTSAINLTAIREPTSIAREHVLDSLTALPILRERGVVEFIDLGSGGGFPGIPLALALPARRALLVDSVGKKARFLETCAAAIGAGGRVSVAAERAEVLAHDPHQRERWPAVVARAVAPLADLAEIACPMIEPRGILVAWKRLPLDDELARAEPAIAAVGGMRPEIVACPVAGLEDHVLVLITKTQSTPPAYPRSAADRKRHPW